MTSRPHAEDIKQAFEAFPNILIEATTSDLKKYVSSEIENSDDPHAIDQEFKNEIIEKISQKANDMYVYVFLMSCDSHHFVLVKQF